MHYFGGGFGFGWIFMIIFWGLIIYGIVILVRSSAGSGHGSGCCGGRHAGHDEHPGTLKNNQALEILKERYAKGEIQKEEFEEKKKDLQ